jgi:hypothetical protein
MTTLPGSRVVEVLLALGDGDSVVVHGQAWTSFEEHGFEVEDLASGRVERVARADAEGRFGAAKLYEVIR